MGLCQWRLERQEAVSRCKARRDMAAEHVVYLRALRAMGVALLQFASVDADHPRQIPRSRGGGCFKNQELGLGQMDKSTQRNSKVTQRWNPRLFLLQVS
ncbi:hypothetical protein OsI_34065 [Oryza sativa Indica Group]|uniref:DUF630 domain-containing protein n=1 Tax=Oryza sativa subsp. indica TaxID=39946 RepID=B8BHI8_ORYSI|nr:hypothetical protein OsI_34065 [Oryza sativa Indica Group]